MPLSILRSNASLLAFFLMGVLLFCLALPLVQLVSGRAGIDNLDKKVIDFKLDALRKASPNRIIIISGSNGWYSIDSDQIAAAFHRPVINLAVHFGLFQYMLEQAVPLVHEGDIVLMPIEYEHYLQPQSMGEMEACVRIFNDFPLSRSPGWYEALNACPNEWEKFRVAFNNIILGPSSESGDITQSLTPAGDHLGNTKSAAKWRGGWTLNASGDMSHIDQPRIENAIARMKKNGAKALITFPVQPLESLKNKAILEKWHKLISKWGEKQGVAVISTPEVHLFPDKCFFDSPCHLHRGCSPKNTQIYIKAIQSVIQ